MLNFREFLSEGSEHNTPYGAAYETATALHLHDMTNSSSNKDPDHQARIAKMKQLYHSSMAQLPSHMQDRANKSAKASADAYLQSLQKNHKIDPKDITEVHHTYAGIDNLVGHKVDRAQNPHDVVVKTKDGKLHGASLKATQGTLSNNTAAKLDRSNSDIGLKTNLSKIWNEGKKKAGLEGKSGKEIKSVRDDPTVKKINNETQVAAAADHSNAFNNAKLEQQKVHLQQLMKSNPDLNYDYVNGEKGKATPVHEMIHNKLVTNAKSLHATETGSGKLQIHDHEGNHILTIEHRPTHGAFNSIQVNAKLGTGTTKKTTSKSTSASAKPSTPNIVNPNTSVEPKKEVYGHIHGIPFHDPNEYNAAKAGM